MSFRKRNVVVGKSRLDEPRSLNASVQVTSPGVQASPLDGRPITSTGTQTLDDILGGHAGLALGQSLLVEEDGTTDFCGSLLRFFAAEGLVQQQHVDVVGLDDQWGRDLPGVVGAVTGISSSTAVDSEKMKIAWRYERLGAFGGGPHSSRAISAPDRMQASGASTVSAPDVTHDSPAQFCHSFDLSKRLVLPGSPSIKHITINTTDVNSYTSILAAIDASMKSTPSHIVHRLLLPNLLSPVLYPLSSSDPTQLLPFLHSLRALLRTFPTRLCIIITFPLSLYPRSTGLVRWIEHIVDGVIELQPFPYAIDMNSETSKGSEEKAQGMLRVHKLPVVTEKGCGSGAGDDMAFSLSRKRFKIMPYHLPPVEGDQEAQSGHGEGGNIEKASLEF